MTTTELIELLRKLEFGGVTREPRQISISVTDKEGCYYPVLDSRSKLVVEGTGDGIAGATLELSISPMPRAESLPCDDHSLESMNEALVASNKHLREKVKDLELRGEVLNPLKSIHDAITLSPKDYSIDKTDAWVYAITVGWGDCLPSIAKKHKWDKDTVNRLKELREQYKRLHENS